MKFKLMEAGYLDNDKKFYDYDTGEVTGHDIFDTKKAEAPYYQEFLSDNGLERLQKYENKTGRIVYMTPLEYYQECAKRFGSTVDKLKEQRGKFDSKIIDHLMQVITKYNRKFPIPNIDYTTNNGQEGLHRMYVAAQLFGWDKEKFPVLIIDWYDYDRHKADEEEKQQYKIYSHLSSAVDKALKYTYDSEYAIAEFKEELDWTLKDEFRYVDGYSDEDINYSDDFPFTMDVNGNDCIIKVGNVEYKFDINDIKVEERKEGTTDELNLDDLPEFTDDELDDVLNSLLKK